MMIPDILTAILAAAGGPPLPGQQSTAEIVAQGADAAPPGTVDLFGGGLMPILMVMLVAMIAFSMFSGRKQKKLRQSMLSALKKHDQVVTRGGVFGSVVEVKSDRVVLKVDESNNTRITVTRDSIDQVMAGAGAGAEQG